MNSNKVPVIALIGRTNVGKSTLFNRLTESRRALVSPVAGTTRDRAEGECLWRGRAIKIVDTGGLDVELVSDIEHNVVAQSEIAMKTADLIIFVTDVRSGPLPQDLEIAARLRDGGVPVIVVANKAERIADSLSINTKEWRLAGLPTPYAVSALRGMGVGDMLDHVWETLAKLGKPPAELSRIEATRIAVIGRPNVGKSSLLNAILGEKRFITSPIAHTTREPNDARLEIDGRQYVLIDTAGIRKMYKVREEGGLEALGVERSQNVVHRADVVLFVVDATAPIASQERTLAGLVQESSAGVIIVVNKWDLIPNKTPETINAFERMLVNSIPYMSWAPVIFVSALTSQRIEKIFELVDLVQSHRYAQATDAELDTFLRSAVKKHLPSRHKGPAYPTALGFTQTGVAPPSYHLTIKAKTEDVLHPSYLRFLENRLREQIDISGTPIRIKVKTARSVANVKT